MIKQTSQQGFTLIEMIVAIGLFVVVALVAIGALLKIVEANNKSQSIKTAITNLNFALDTMTREMRVGTNYTCTSGAKETRTLLDSSTSCNNTTSGSGSWSIAFNSSIVKTRGGTDPSCHLIHVFYFNASESTLEKGEQEECDGEITYFPMIYGGKTDSSKVYDSVITFDRGDVKVVTGTDIQPYVQFHFKGYSGVKEKLKSYFEVQTTVSQRLPN